MIMRNAFGLNYKINNFGPLPPYEFSSARLSTGRKVIKANCRMLFKGCGELSPDGPNVRFAQERIERFMDVVKVAMREPVAEVKEEWRQFCFGTNPVKTFKRVIIWCLASILFFNNCLVPIQIVGSSMAPTYRSGSLNFVNKLSYAAHPPLKGDVIALEAEGELLLKRIVAVPGEKVAIHAGKVHVNGVSLDDAFADNNIPWEMAPVLLGTNEFFVIGDNRAASIFCKVHRSQILGKIIF